MERRPPLDRVLRTAEGRLLLGWRLALFLVLTFSVQGVLTALLPSWLLAGTIAVLVGAVVAGVALLALEGRSPGALGFYVRWSALSESGLGLMLGTAVALAVVFLIALSGGLRWASDEGTALDWVFGGLGALAFLALPAAAEEALFRGYPFQALTQSWGPLASLAVTAVLFAGLHLGNPGVTVIGTLNVMAAGVFLGVVYLRTSSLWWATGVHLGWNWATGYLADVPVSGLELLDAPLYEGVPRGPDWLGGGGFGPEGSIVATAVMIGASVWCWRAKWLRSSEAAIAVRPLVLIEERGA